MKTLIVILSALLVLALLAYPTALGARTWYILPDGTGDAPTIQAGIDSASVGDTVLIACGIYFESGLNMTVPVTLRGETGEPDCVAIDAQATDTVIYCDWSDGTASLESITFTGGHGVLCGGVCMTGSAAVNYDRCVFVDNQGGVMPGGGRGGAVGCFEQSYALFRNCRLENNGAYGGGGVFCADQAEVSLDTCVLVNNSAVWGGGVELRDDSVATITSCTFHGNNSYSWEGAGITNWSSSTPQIANTIIAFAEAGSAIDGYCELTACDLYGNAHGDWVGAIADQLGMGCNMAEDPLFCDPENMDFSLQSNSPCLPENNECDVLIGAFGEGCVPSRVSEPWSFIGRARLFQNNPNPFNPSTSIKFAVPNFLPVKLTIYGIDGRYVSTLTDNAYTPGPHSVTWNGTDDQGRAVASGTYIYRLEAGEYVESRRMVLLR